MTNDAKPSQKRKDQSARECRLADALKENLRRRKARDRSLRLDAGNSQLTPENSHKG